MIPFANPYVLLGAASAALALSVGSFSAGHHWATTKAEAERARQADVYTAQLHEAIAYGSEVAAKLAAAEGRIVIKTVEVIKHVPQVTTGTTPCLSGAAVSLLNSGADEQRVSPNPGEPDGESPAAPAATDRDVAYWIAEANRQYEVAAARLNAIIDVNQGATP